MFVFVLCFIVGVFSATFKVEKYYSQDVTCSNYYTSWFVTPVTSCVAVSTCENLNNNAGRIVECVGSLPTFPDGWVTFSAYQTIDCTGNVAIMAAPLATCTGYWIGSPVQVNCAGSQCRVINCGAAQASCAGCPYQDTNGTNVCIRGNPTSGYTMLSYSIAPPPFTTARTTTSTRANNVTTAPANVNTTRPGCGCMWMASIPLLVTLIVILST
jgi:hypothetical protein